MHNGFAFQLRHRGAASSEKHVGPRRLRRQLASCRQLLALVRNHGVQNERRELVERGRGATALRCEMKSEGRPLPGGEVNLVARRVSAEPRETSYEAGYFACKARVFLTGLRFSCGIEVARLPNCTLARALEASNQSRAASC